MVYSVVGVAHRQGEFNGNKYDNFHVFCSRDALTERDETGLITKEFKVPAIHFSKNPVYVGDTIDELDISYDAYKRIKSLK